MKSRQYIQLIETDANVSAFCCCFKDWCFGLSSKGNLPEPVERFSELFLGTPARSWPQTVSCSSVMRWEKERIAYFSVDSQDCWLGLGNQGCALGFYPPPPVLGQEGQLGSQPGRNGGFPGTLLLASAWPVSHPRLTPLLVFSVIQWPAYTGSAGGCVCGCCISPLCFPLDNTCTGTLQRPRTDLALALSLQFASIQISNPSQTYLISGGG